MNLHTIHAEGKKLGRVATEAANLLRGKDSVHFAPNKTPGTHVVIAGAGKLALSERKRVSKLYQRYSGYPSGRKTETLKSLTARRGIAEVVRRAVYGMLPKNPTRARLIKNLTVEE